MRFLLIALTLFFSCSISAATSSIPTLEDGHGKGYWWYKDKKEEESVQEFIVPPKKDDKKEEEPKKEEKKDCSGEDSWDVKCGFVDPGENFEFMEKQRDELLKQMVMGGAKNQKKVEDFQYYMKWMVKNSIEVARMWQFNMVQNPDLDPNAMYPAGYLGLQMVSKIKSAQTKEIFDYIRENGGMFYYSKDDCIYCHEMAPWVLKMAKDNGIEIWNAALDDKCIEGFDNCVTAPETLGPATALEVKIVPALFIFVEPDIHIRVASGMVDSNVLEGRIINYMHAARQAALNSVQNSDRWKADVDFSAGSRPSGSATVDTGDIEATKEQATEFTKKYKDF